jgi:Protein of unknown function (DUF4232)
MNQSLRALSRALAFSLVAIVAVACNTSTTTRTAAPAASVSPAPAATASPATAGGACAPTDLALVSGGWSAAAGSRGADVSVENRGGGACRLPAGPAVAILDAAGTQLLESAPAGNEPGPTLEPGTVATFTVLFSNWCDETAALPLHVALRAGDASVPVPDLDLTADDLPPCNGPGQPPAVSANPWEPVSG